MAMRQQVPEAGTPVEVPEALSRRGPHDYSDEDGNVRYERPVEILAHRERVRTGLVVALVAATIVLVFTVVGLTLAGMITPWVALAVAAVSTPLTVATKNAVAFYFK